MKFELLTDDTIQAEPAGVMIVKDTTHAVDYSEKFPEWVVLSSTKFTKNQMAAYLELMSEHDRWVFMQPSKFIRDVKTKRSQIIRAMCQLYPERVEAYGHAQIDTVPEMMIYCSTLFPTVQFPTTEMTSYAAWAWRTGRKGRTQIQEQVWYDTPENVSLIKTAINN